MRSRESVIINFVKQNMKLLQQKDFSELLYKKNKTDFFYKYRKVIRHPKDSEIATVMVKHVIRKNIIDSEEKLNRFLNLPFLNQNIHDEKIFRDLLKLQSVDTYMIVNPSELDNAEYVQKLEDEIQKKIKREHESEFNEQKKQYLLEIEEMEKKLATLPTKLQIEDYAEPTIPEPDINSNQLWWQELNLSTDPFPVAEGLQKIDDSSYDNIIVQTKIFGKYIDFSKSLKDQIYKNTIFYGDFGSGKTAFFDYLKKTFLTNRILPIYIQLQASVDSGMNQHNFHRELIATLRFNCKKFNINLDFKNDDDVEYIRKILLHIKNNRAFDGVIIFVDDLHKERKAFDAVLDFLSYLQIFTSNMTKFELDVAIYVAGLPTWEEKIKREPRVSGSLIRSELMPDITPMNAHEMLNRRMIEFSKNKDKKNIIGRSFVDGVYKKMEERHVVITFREFVKIAIEEFNKGNFDVVLTVNPRAISSKNIESIKEMIQNTPKLNYQFEHLFERIANKNIENRSACFDILGTIYLEHGIYENSPQFERNQWAIQQLSRSGLIHYWDGDEDLKWLINNNFINFNKNIIDQFGVSMEDYLIPAFVGPCVYQLPQNKSKEYDTLNKIYEKLTDNTEKLLMKDTMDYCEKIFQVSNERVINATTQELTDLCIQSLSTFTKTFAYMMNISLSSTNDLQILSFWQKFWYTPKSLDEFINQIDTDVEFDIYNAYNILGLHNEIFPSLVEFLESQLRKNELYIIDYTKLTLDECQLFDRLRDKWHTSKYSDIIYELIPHVEKTIRKHVYNILLMLYGNNRSLCYDFRIKDEIKQNNIKKERRGYTPTNNELQKLGRRSYKILMTSNMKEKSERGEKNWSNIFKHIFYGWDESKMYNYLNIFGDYNTIVSHNDNCSIEPSQQSILLQFIVDSMFVYSKFNESYDNLLKNYFLKDNKYYFKFNKSETHGDTVDMTSESMTKFIKKLHLKDIAIIDKHDPESDTTLYNDEYRNIMMMTAILINDKKLIEDDQIELELIDDNVSKLEFKIIKQR